MITVEGCACSDFAKWILPDNVFTHCEFQNGLYEMNMNKTWKAKNFRQICYEIMQKEACTNQP